MLLALPSHQSSLAHAYIVESVDEQKAHQALIELAQILLCQNTGGELSSACGHCHSCSLFSANSHPDFFTNDLEQNSIGVDEVRQVSEFLTKTAQLSGNQVVLLHQVEKMTENASNALLKTLEEPTAKSYLLLSCQHKSQLLPTILSRCQFLTLPKQSKEQLQQAYHQLPDYLIGFSKGAESKLQAWLEDENSLTEFDEIYQAFISWLKQSSPDFKLADLVSGKPELMEFLLYLISRRVYQLSIKQKESAVIAQQCLSDFQQSSQMIQGANQNLGLVSLLAKLRELVI